MQNLTKAVNFGKMDYNCEEVDFVFGIKGIEVNISPAEIVARAVCAILAVLVIFLLAFSMIFSLSNGAPNLFGKNVYVVKTDAFDIITKGSAVMSSKVPYADILPGNIVVYKNADDKAALAEIHASQQTDGIYSFTALSETGEDLTILQSDIIGKAIQSSGFLGGLISFAKSPAGVMLIAVIPCFTLLGYEVFKFIQSRFGDKTTIMPVKKQDETPTFVPRPKVDKALTAYKGVTMQSDDDEPNYFQEKSRGERNKRAGEAIDDVFFKAPKKPDRISPEDIGANSLNRLQQRIPPPVQKPVPRMPLSQKRLNEVIAETKAKRKMPQEPIPSTPPQESSFSKTVSQNTTELDLNARTAINNTTSMVENLRQYNPRKQNSQRLNATHGIPRLDAILKEDDDNTGYNIEGILNSFDKKKNNDAL